MNMDEYMDIIDDYANLLEQKHYSGKLGHKQYVKSLVKLEQWEEVFATKYSALLGEEFE